MGDGEVWMFDDNGLGNESRLLIVKVDEDAAVARIEWEYPIGALAQIYGDADPVPSGNVLASYWRSRYGNRTADDQEQCGVMEVTRGSKEIAWHLRVFGKACPDAACGLEYYESGWTMYSVERFYEAPVLPSVVRPRVGATIRPPSCDGGVLTFTAWNTFKVSSRRRGTFELLARATRRPLAAGDFSFEAHWRPTNVSVAWNTTIDAGASSVDAELVVRNARGAAARYNLTCTCR